MNNFNWSQEVDMHSPTPEAIYFLHHRSIQQLANSHSIFIPFIPQNEMFDAIMSLVQYFEKHLSNFNRCIVGLKNNLIDNLQHHAHLNCFQKFKMELCHRL
jgi:hypothetical protein